MTDDAETPRPTISDPQRVRALAHPLRLRILDALAHHGDLTATQCADLTGESVANCSFHLRTLAKYGYIEPGEPRGREKPWRSVGRSQTVIPDFDDPASVQAVSVMAMTALDRQAEMIRASIRSSIDEDRDWILSTTMSSTAFWVTRDELAEVSAAINQLMERFEGRLADPATRPEGSRLARMFATTFLDDAAHDVGGGTGGEAPSPRGDDPTSEG